MRLLPALLVAGLAAHASAVTACGVCIEDRVAAVYDHAVIERAKAKGQRIAFVGLEGAGAATAERQVRASAAAIKGVDRESIRFSGASASLSMAYDPQRLSDAALLASLGERLQAGKIHPLPLRVITSEGKLEQMNP